MNKKRSVNMLFQTKDIGMRNEVQMKNTCWNSKNRLKFCKSLLVFSEE